MSFFSGHGTRGQALAVAIALQIAVSFFLAGFAFAEPGQAPAQLPASPVSIGGVLQVLFGLIVVLATVAGAAWILKRLAPGQVSAGGAIKLIGGIAVGPKERVVVVEVGDTWLVVGVAPGQVSALHNMPRLEIFQNAAPSGSADQRFAVWLREVIKRRGAEAGK
jgi:flagellar protein FliO/FliZ